MRDPLGAPTLIELLECPERGMALDPAEAAAMLAKVAGIAAVLQLAASCGPRREPEVPTAGGRLLTVSQVAERLGLTEKQVYRRAGRWPFTKRASKGTLRFSEPLLEAWLADPSSRSAHTPTLSSPGGPLARRKAVGK